ncbi:MAG TPA: glycerate kinase [Gaiellaceae bacterium]|nr:glycerate kinase [Gaiellaceae bacterium]
MSLRALACPASLKGSLSASAAADALKKGFEDAGVPARSRPVADGGEGTLDVLCHAFETYDVVDAFGRPRSARVGLLDADTRVVEAAEAIPFEPDPPDILAASSRGLGVLIGKLPRGALLVTVGGTATMDGGAGLLDVLDELPGPTRVLCDVRTRLFDAPRLYGPQKGATAEQVAELEERFRAMSRLAPFAEIPGSGAAGGLGAAFAALGADLVPGADTVLDLVDFDPDPYDLVVTGEGTVDATTWEGKAPAAVARRCRRAGVPCVVFGGRVATESAPEGAVLEALSGDTERAEEDLVELGRSLGAGLRGA